MKIYFKLAIIFVIGCLFSNAQNITTVVGINSANYNGDSLQGLSTALKYPEGGMAIDTSGNVYFCDFSNNRVRKYNPTTGLVTNIAGNGISGFGGDGGQAKQAMLKTPHAVALDKNGNVYIADYGNYRIRKVDAATGIITTIAGTGIYGYNGDGIAATTANLFETTGIALDTAGNVYFSHFGDMRVRRIDKVSGLISTYVGTGTAGFNGDNILATNAQLNFPIGLAFDKNNDLFIADKDNYRVRKVTTVSGIITTVVGNGVYGNGGNGGVATSASLKTPYDVEVDTLGNIYVADRFDNTVRMVSSGTINAFAGNGTSGFSGDGGPAVNAELSACSGIAVNQCGGLYIVDRSNSRIRKVSSFNFSATSANVKCFAACTGSIGSSATGGLAPYTYSWSALGSGSVHTNVCAGNYLGICTDSKGCKEQISMNITQFPQLVLSVNQQTNVTCNNNGKAIGSVSGGAGAPHTFTWSTSSSTTSIGSNLSAGIQTVSVDDANGCIATQTFNILFTPTLGLTVQFTDKICGSLGSATATANGTGPITYSWSSSASTGSVVSSLNIGNYSVMATDGNGCSNTQSFAIALNTPSFASVPICFVTVDSLSQNNVIIWDKTSFPSADSFFVYREIGSNVYKKIQAQSYNQLSQFVDTVKTLYFPNTGNPNVGTYRYKIKTIDTCGGASEFSPYHNTLFLINNNGTFTWSQFYEIEGETNPVLSYILERDDFSTGNWVAVGSVAGTQQFVIDPNYSSFIGTASWRVRTQWNINCQASKGVSAGNASYSNKVTNNDVGLDERLNKIQMSVFPNPTSGKFVIQLNSKNEDKQINKIEIVNLLGGVVYLVEGNLSPNTNIDLGAEDNGIYFCKISIDNQILVKKIVLAK